MKTVRKLIALAIWALVAMALETPGQAAASRPQKTLVLSWLKTNTGPGGPSRNSDRCLKTSMDSSANT